MSSKRKNHQDDKDYEEQAHKSAEAAPIPTEEVPASLPSTPCPQPPTSVLPDVGTAMGETSATNPGIITVILNTIQIICHH